MRAAFKNANSGKTIQGGSTLTMQLIRTLYTGDRDRSLKRKVREAKLAEELENAHPGREGKKWILTKYLNSVPYGTNDGKQAIGIQAAARAYFNKPRRRSHARGVRAAGGAAAGAERLQPVQGARRGDGAAQRGAAQDGRPRLHLRQRRAGGDRRAAGAAAQHVLPPQARELLLRLRHRRADQALRPARRARRRPADPHDDRPRAAAQGARGDRQQPELRRRALVGDRQHRSAATATSARWRRRRSTRTRSSTSPPTASASPARHSRSWRSPPPCARA